MAKIKDNEAAACEVLGIGAVLTDDEGRVCAHAFDFDRSGYGGFKMWEAQRIRVRRAVKRKFIEAYCSNVVHPGIDEFACESIVDNLRNKGKLRLTFFAIGHELDGRELN